MKKKISIIFVATIILTGLTSVFLFIRREKDLGLHWLTENSRSQLDLMGDLVLGDLEKSKGQMARVATLMEAGQAQEAQKALGNFLGVAAISPETGDILWKVNRSEAPLVMKQNGRIDNLASGTSDGIPNGSANTNPTANTNVNANANTNANANVDWSAPWIEKLKNSEGRQADLKFGAHQTSEGEVRSGVAMMASVRDRKSGQVNKVQLIGVLPKAIFQDLIDRLKVQGVHVFLTTETGLTLAHSVSEYVGNSMKGDRTYEEISKDKNLFGSIKLKDVRGEDILSFFVKLPAAKLILVSQWRKDLWVMTDWSFYGQGIFLILAFALLGVAGLQPLLRRLQAESARGEVVEKVVERVVEKIVERPAPESLSMVTSPSPLKAPQASVPDASSMAVSAGQFAGSGPAAEATAAVQSLSLPPRPFSLYNSPAPSLEQPDPQISIKILDRLVTALKAPLLSVLGHVQIARLNPQGGSLQSIETEIRNARDVLDRVGQFSGQTQIPSVTVPLYEVVEAALRMVEGAFLRGGIKIVREIPPDLAIKVDIDEFKTALAAIFRNSAEAMEKVLRKSLILRARSQNGSVIFEIDDTGEGILPENVQKIFEPMFTTRSTLEHRGLGLAMAQGILRQHLAEIVVKSRVGEGTTFTIKMPISHEVVQSLSERGMSVRPARDFSTPSLAELEKAAIETAPAAKGSETTPLVSSALQKLGKDLDFKEEEGTSRIELNKDDLLSFDEFGLFEDGDSEDEAFSDFQFGRLDLAESGLNEAILMGSPTEATSPSESTPPLSKAEIMAQKAIHGVVPNPNLKPGPSKKLKKKEEPLANMKVHIPRPEERL